MCVCVPACVCVCVCVCAPALGWIDPKSVLIAIELGIGVYIASVL